MTKQLLHVTGKILANNGNAMFLVPKNLSAKIGEKKHPRTYKKLFQTLLPGAESNIKEN